MAHRLPNVTTLSQAEIWAEAIKHRGLCGKVARTYAGRGLAQRELVTEGLFGVYRAIELYDVTKLNPATGAPYAFSTYAFRRIHQAMGKAVDDTGGTIRIPPQHRRHLPEAAAAANIRSLDASIDPIATEVPTGLDDDQVEQLRIGIAALTRRQQQVLSAIFFDGERPKGIAARLGLSKQCVDKHRRNGLDRLREMFHSSP